MNSKDKPNNDKNGTGDHEEKPKKPEITKQYWTQHRLTLIAYEAQYLYAKQTPQLQEQGQSETETKKKTARRKVMPEYQCAFLHVSSQQSEDIKIEQLIKPFESLNWLFTACVDENLQSVQQFIKIMLQLKHSAIVKQFCQIYNTIVKELKSIEFHQVEKEQSRFQLLQNIKNKIVTEIASKKDRFQYFTAYLRDDEKQTKKLILVEAYCLLAQKFNFNINQFYSEAFAVNFEGKPVKKVKKSE